MCFFGLAATKLSAVSDRHARSDTFAVLHGVAWHLKQQPDVSGRKGPLLQQPST